MHHSPAPNDDDDDHHMADGPDVQVPAVMKAEEGGMQCPAPTPSSPVRRGTTSSTATTVASLATSETGSTTYSLESVSAPASAYSPGDGVKTARGTRRRTGPLSAEQREKAALIRKLGACHDCRRRRVGCHPEHHQMTWEDVFAKFRSRSPAHVHDKSAPPNGRPLSPASYRSAFTQDPHDMDMDDAAASAAAVHTTPLRPAPFDARMRTPLPSGPRLIDSAKTDLLQTAASRMAASTFRSPYVAADVLALHWADDSDEAVRGAMDDLVAVMSQLYHYHVDMQPIPPSTDGCQSSLRWMSQTVNDFIDRRNQRDVLKIVYYQGHTCLDGNRGMVLASSRSADAAFAIRWSGIQQTFETASSDTLIIMDAAYFPSTQLVRQQGMVELLAASAGDHPAQGHDRAAFTRALAAELRARAHAHNRASTTNPLSAADLHAKLLPLCQHGPDHTDQQVLPSPLHMQLSGNTRLPSILLAPVRDGDGGGGDDDSDSDDAVTCSPPVQESLSCPGGGRGGGAQLTLTFKLADESVNVASWVDWLRLMPDGIKDVRVDGPHRNAVR